MCRKYTELQANFIPNDNLFVFVIFFSRQPRHVDGPEVLVDGRRGLHAVLQPVCAQLGQVQGAAQRLEVLRDVTETEDLTFTF